MRRAQLLCGGSRAPLAHLVKQAALQVQQAQVEASMSVVLEGGEPGAYYTVEVDGVSYYDVPAVEWPGGAKLLVHQGKVLPR